MSKRLWLKLGIIQAVIFEVILFVLYYIINAIFCKQITPIQDKPSLSGSLGGLRCIVNFPPSIEDILFVLIFGFIIGAIVGYLIEKFSKKD